MPKFEQLQNFLKKHFPDQISPEVENRFEIAFNAYLDWNEKVNLISRKDIENLAERHFLHSLAIAKLVSFLPGSRILDAGTGGGFPGIPLAILFPETEFHLVDSIQKKIKVVKDVMEQCELENVQPIVQRVEQLPDSYDFVVSRAVASFDKFMPWIKKKIRCQDGPEYPLKKGVLYLRGGEPRKEKAILRSIGYSCEIYMLSEWFEGEFFESKYLVHIPLCK